MKKIIKKILVLVIILSVIVILFFVLNRKEGDEPLNKKECLSMGGKWVEISEIKNYNIDLNIKNTEDCIRYGGSCSSERVISSTTIGICDNENDCWHTDFYEDTCLLP
jgi:hypothetical protein